MVTYNISRKGTSSSPALHSLIRELHLLENTLHCSLSVVHVPGDTMISQGSDGLSRGCWIHGATGAPPFDASQLFCPITFSQELFTWALGLVMTISKHAEELHHLPYVPWHPRGDLDDWSLEGLVNKNCFWTVSPSLCRQAMTQAALAWSESPLDSCHIFVVPRIFQREFGRVNKYYEFLGQHDDPRTYSVDPPHPLPFLVFVCCPHRRRLCDLPSRLDPPPPFREPPWVTAQMDALHRVQDA